MKISLLRLGNTLKETFGDSKWALKKTQSYEKREEIKYTNTMREERRERERERERERGGTEGGREKEGEGEERRREGGRE